jgi:hypothetical protein
MQEFTRWLLGKELYEGWKWLWGVPHSPPATVKTKDETILEDIARSLEVVRAIIVKIQGTVEQVRVLKQATEDKYKQRQQAHQELIGMSLESKRQGDIFEARSAMGQAIQLELTLPKFKERSENSQRMLMTVQDFRTQKLADFALLEIDLETAKVQKAVNDSIGLDCAPDLIILQEKLQNVQADIEDRYHQILVEIQLSDPSNCELGKTFSTEDLDERIRDHELRTTVNPEDTDERS